MKSFLITFKPASENAERGWPMESLLKLVQRQAAGERVVEDWRFRNQKDVSLGDRVFLLRQGKGGPAIIGYGTVIGAPENLTGTWQVPIEFEVLLNPTTHVLADKAELLAIEESEKVWRTQVSGVLLPQHIARHLEESVVGRPSIPTSDESASNPDWTRDELILALNVYLRGHHNPPGKGSKEIRDLSEALQKLGDKLFPRESRADTFRNENGVYMKLMNFRRLDPQYNAQGKTGLSRGSNAEEEVWAAFSGDAANCERVAAAIIRSLDDTETGTVWADPTLDEGIQEDPEGRLLTRKHVTRERNRKLVESKIKQAWKRHGKLACEACSFEAALFYGDRGRGFIECHHTKPVATLAEGQKTHLDDLALVCANCHRMIHRFRPWLSMSDLKELMSDS
jgi:5-methylcytosine-specific restriction protein A